MYAFCPAEIVVWNPVLIEHVESEDVSSRHNLLCLTTCDQ